jgi:hypothetical protein
MPPVGVREKTVRVVALEAAFCMLHLSGGVATTSSPRLSIHREGALLGGVVRKGGEPGVGGVRRVKETVAGPSLRKESL